MMERQQVLKLVAKTVDPVRRGRLIRVHELIGLSQAEGELQAEYQNELQK
jgi:hypothetical protein